MKAATESAVLHDCLELLRIKNVFHWRQNQGAIPLKDGGYRRFVGLRGVSDILGVLPLPVLTLTGRPTTVGVLLAVEVKKPGGKPSKEQRAFLAAVHDAGGLAWVVDDVRELDTLLRGVGL